MLNHKILLVEDELNLAKTISLNLELDNYSVLLAINGREALNQFNIHFDTIELVLLDVMIPEINGFDLCKQFKSKKPSLPIIF